MHVIIHRVVRGRPRLMVLHVIADVTAFRSITSNPVDESCGTRFVAYVRYGSQAVCRW